MRVRLGARATAIAAGAGALWVASEEAGTVTRVDPRSSAVVASIPVGNAPTALAVGDGAVWVVSRNEGTLSRVDPDTNATSGSVRVGTDLTDVAVGEGAVWVAGGEEGTVARVDSGDLGEVKKRKTGSSPSAVAVADGSVWIAAVPSEAAHRGGTLRVDLPLDDRRRGERAQRRRLQPRIRLGDLACLRRAPRLSPCRRRRQRDARRRARDAATGS